MSAPKAKIVALPRPPGAKPAPRVYEFYGVMLGDGFEGAGSLRAWRDEAPAWNYAKTMGVKPKRYKIVEID